LPFSEQFYPVLPGPEPSKANSRRSTQVIGALQLTGTLANLDANLEVELAFLILLEILSIHPILFFKFIF
jgi:hypothetical protein